MGRKRVGIAYKESWLLSRNGVFSQIDCDQ